MWCPLRFLRKNDVQFVFTSIWGSCFIYVICVCLHIIVSNMIATMDDVRVVQQQHDGCLIWNRNYLHIQSTELTPGFLCNVLWIIVCHFDPFLLAIVLSVLLAIVLSVLWFTASDYSFGISFPTVMVKQKQLKFLISNHWIQNMRTYGAGHPGTGLGHAQTI